MNDTDIIELFWNRDEQGILETDKKYGNTLLMLAKNIVQILEDAKECVNDTYLKAWENIPPTRPKYYFAYLAKIIRHISFGRLDYYNAAKRKGDVVALEEELENCIPLKMSDEIRIESEKIGKEISKFLKHQKLLHQQIFVYRYFYGDSIKDIADELALGEAKVKSILFRMRKALRKHLEESEIWI